MSIKNVIALVGIGIIGFSNYCSAYTRRVVSWLEKPVMVKLNLACVGKGPAAQQVDPSVVFAKSDGMYGVVDF